MRRLSSLALAAGLAACGPSAPPPVITDAGPRDAQAPVVDAGTDAGPVDSGPPVDGGGTVDPGRCRFDPAADVVELGTETLIGARTVSVAPGADSFGVTWLQSVDGFAEIHTRVIPSEGATGTSRAITSSFWTNQRPTIESVGTRWMLAWYSNEMADFDVWTRMLEADGTAGGAGQRITTRTGRDDTPVLLRMSTGVLAAWIEETDPPASARSAVTRRLDDSGAPTAAATPIALTGMVPTVPVLARRAGGASLAFATLDRDAVLVPLDANGARMGEPIVLSTEGNAGGTVDLAAGEGGGAIAFDVLVADVRPEIRARLIEGTGLAAGPELPLAQPDETAKDVSMTQFAGGYLASYRSTSGGTTRIRVAIRDAELGHLRTLDLPEASPDGGPTRIRASADGRLLVAWVDDMGASGSRMRAVRIRCD